MRGRWRLAALAAVALLSVGTAACGDDDEGDATSAAAEASAEVSSAAAEATSAAESVVSEAESVASEAESAATSAAEEATSAAEEATSAAEEPAIEPVTLRIGFSGALEGPYAAYDATLLKGMEYAAKKLAEAGDPVTVEIVSKNNKGDQALAATTQQELIDDGIKVFILTTADPYAAQGSLITAAGGIMSVGGNTAPQIGKDLGDRTFYFVFGDNVQAAAVAEYACEQGYKNAWVLSSEEIPYTKDMPRYFKDAFEQCGGAIAGEDVYKIGQTEFRTQVTKIQNADPAPDVIFSPMFVPDSGIFLKALRGAGLETPFLGTDGNDSTLFADSGGDAVDGAIFSTHGFAGEGAIADFLADFEAVTGAAAESNTFEAIGRDNVYALVAAVKAAGGSVEPDDLKTAIEGLKDVPLLTGNMTMDPATHIPIKDVTLIRMNGTDQELVQTKTPAYIPAP